MDKIFILACFAFFSIYASEKKTPNFIIIYLDDMGYSDVGEFKNKKINTPNIDSLSKDGQVWTDFYASSAVCTPSRAGLLTGRLPVRNGLYGDQIAVFFPNSKRGLPSEETTIAEVFQDNGYKTAIFGKWHLGDSPDFLPTRHGFDEYIGIPYSNDMDWNVNGITFDKLISNPELIESAYSEISETISKMIFNPKVSDWNVPLLRSNKLSEGFIDEVIERPANQNDITKNYTIYSQDFIERSVISNTPFFLFLSHSMPHVPLFRSNDFRGHSELGIYGDVIEEIDWSVGEILDSLIELGIRDNTFILFTSDNGPWLLYGDHGGKAEPLRSGKGTTFEGGMRVWTIIDGPGVKTGVVDDIGMQTDIFNTFLSLANIKHEIFPEDSFDLSETILNKTASPRKFVPFYSGSELRAFRYESNKIHYITQGAYGMAPERNVHSKPILFDLSKDIGETTDISDENNEILNQIVMQSNIFQSNILIEKSILDVQFQD